MTTLKHQNWLSRFPLWLEIGIALVLKVLVLYAIHQIFFNHPVAVHMQVPLPKVEQHFISAPAVIDAQADPKSAQATKANADVRSSIANSVSDPSK